jgi:hypothetical protein
MTDSLTAKADGRPTADPAAVTARGGTPMLMGGADGGFRGFALSLWTEALCGPSLNRLVSDYHPSALSHTQQGDVEKFNPDTDQPLVIFFRCPIAGVKIRYYPMRPGAPPPPHAPGRWACACGP